MDQYEFIVNTEQGERLDIFLSKKLAPITRSHIQKVIESGYAYVNDALARSSYKLAVGDRVNITVPIAEPLEIKAENIPLDVVFEDEQILVINKARGMTVHPAPGSKEGTLVNAILAHCTDLSGIGGVERPGIVHRLDKDTTGLIVVAKTDLAHSCLQKQIQQRSATRKYKALVWGETAFNEAIVDAPIGRHPNDRQKMAVIKETSRYTARPAITNLTVIRRFKAFTFIEARLDTGRTHQIRVHCSFIGHPVVGDPMYGGTKRHIPTSYSKREQVEIEKLIDELNGQALHAYFLAFDHPTSRKRLEFETSIPRDMASLIKYLEDVRVLPLWERGEGENGFDYSRLCGSG